MLLINPTGILFISAFILCCTAALNGAPTREPIKLDSQHQLFLDDFIIEEAKNVKREIGAPIKHPNNPVIKREHFWEASRCELYGSVVFDERTKRLQAFYTAMNKPYDGKVAYAESFDGGITWKKPLLNLHPIDSAKTNIVWPGRYYVAGPSIFIDRKETDPAKRYKMLTGDFPIPLDSPLPRGPKGMDAVYSMDGIHWTPAPNNPVIPDLVSDTGQCVFRDPETGKFVAFIRIWDWNIPQRQVGRIESEDFVNWSKPEVVYAPTSEDVLQHWHFYGLSVTPYAGLYIGLLWIFPDTPESRDWQSTKPVTWPELVVSRDKGRNWQRVSFGKPFIPNGPAGTFDSRQIRPASSLTLLKDRILVFYSASPDPHVAPHKYDIGFATLRVDGFASLVAHNEPGVITTKPLSIRKNSRLMINARTDSNGWIKAEIVDSEGKPINGFRLNEATMFSGDSINTQLRWRQATTLPSTGSAGVRIRFSLKNANLFSFWAD